MMLEGGTDGNGGRKRNSFKNMTNEEETQYIGGVVKRQTRARK